MDIVFMCSDREGQEGRFLRWIAQHGRAVLVLPADLAGKWLACLETGESQDALGQRLLEVLAQGPERVIVYFGGPPRLELQEKLVRLLVARGHRPAIVSCGCFLSSQAAERVAWGLGLRVMVSDHGSIASCVQSILSLQDG